MTFRRISSLVLLFLFSYPVYSMPVDSLSGQRKIKTSIYFLSSRDFIYGNPKKMSIDTTISTIHHVNPALDLHYNYLGTEGSACEPQVFVTGLTPYSFNSIRSYDLHMLSTDSLKFFRTNKRFSELQYHTGNFKEQRIAFIHSQNITKTWNAGFHFDRQGVKDYMKFSNTFRSRLALFTWYASPNSRYNIFASAIWNTIKNGVNGGLTSDSIFDNTIVTNVGIKGLAYQVSNASQHVRRNIFAASQFYDFGKIDRDTSGNIISRSPAFRLNHTINYERRNFTYQDEDPDSNFYADYYYGPATYDSIHSDEVTNRVSFQLPADTLYASTFLRKWSSGIYAEQQHVEYGQRSDSSWNNISAGANIFLKSDESSIEFFANASYVISGFDDGNYLLDAKLYSPRYSFGKFGAILNTGLTSPDLNYRWYDGNNFRWKNNFVSIKTSKIVFSYELEKYHLLLQAARTLVSDYVYLNVSASPSQYSKTVIIDQLKVVKNFNYRYWHFDNTIIFQQSDKKGIIPVPSIVSEQSLYFRRSYFNKAILIAFGLSLSYNSSYYANEFMPSIGMFRLQNTTETGGYPRFDLFINSEIKTARIFLKFENIADDLFQNSYYLTPHYPMPGRVLKFGVIWRFFDQ